MSSHKDAEMYKINSDRKQLILFLPVSTPVTSKLYTMIIVILSRWVLLKKAKDNIYIILYSYKRMIDT